MSSFRAAGAIRIVTPDPLPRVSRSTDAYRPALQKLSELESRSMVWSKGYYVSCGLNHGQMMLMLHPEILGGRGCHNLLFGLTNDAFGYILSPHDYGSFKVYEYISATSLHETMGEILVGESIRFINDSPAPLL